MELNKYTLGEISSNNRGYYGIGASAAPLGTSKYTYLRISDINDDSTLNEGSFVSLDDENAGKYLLYKNDIVFARTGASAGRNYFYDGSIPNMVYAGFLIKFSINHPDIEPEYIKYYLQSPFYYKWVRTVVTGSTRPNINEKTFRNLPILAPQIKKQKKIVEILSTIDNSIKINNQINLNLQQIGQRLYKHWFIDFEFPNEQGEPYKSSGGKMVYNDKLKREIPLGWGTGYLGDNKLTEIIKTGVQQYNDTKNYVATADVDDISIKNFTNTTYEGKPSRANMTPIKNSVWFAKMKESNKKMIVLPNNLTILKKYIFSTGFMGLVCLNNSLYYIWNLILNEDFNIIRDQLSTGTVMPGVSNRTIKNYQILIPSQEVLDKFHEIIDPIERKILHNIDGNKVYNFMKKILLPKLLSGEIDL